MPARTRHDIVASDDVFDVIIRRNDLIFYVEQSYSFEFHDSRERRVFSVKKINHSMTRQQHAWEKEDGNAGCIMTSRFVLFWTIWRMRIGT